MTKTVIFDMDGVIVDSEPYHCQSWLETYKEIGININEEYYFSKICGQHGLVSTSMVLNDFNKSHDQEELIRKKEQLVCKHVEGKINPIQGVLNLIKNLKENHIKLGLASSTSYTGVKSILKNIGINNHFSVIHAGESVKKGKPNPDVYLKTAKMLEIDPKNCVVIEDSSSGVISAKRAGMKVIGILNGRNNKEQLQYADFIANSFLEINIELISNL